MTNQQLHDIFSRFQNLNLLFLIRDLELNQAARGTWVRTDYVDDRQICPLAHGWRFCRLWGLVGGDWNEALQPWADYTGNGWEGTKAGEFPMWWDLVALEDRHLKDGEWPAEATRRRNQLLQVLQDIYAERLADAEVVQAITAAPLAEEALQEEIA